MWAPAGRNVSTLFLALRASQDGAVQAPSRPGISAAAIAGIVTGVVLVLVGLILFAFRKKGGRIAVKDAPAYTQTHEYPLPLYVHPLPSAHLPTHHPMMSVNDQASGYYQQPWAPRVRFGQVAVYKV